MMTDIGLQASPASNNAKGLVTHGQTYQYSALDPTKNEIRLLHIHSSEHDDDIIACSLSTVSLHGHSDFDALSYVWGDVSNTKEIIVDSCRVSVTVNLEIALKRLRRRGVKHVWADAVCINQKDDGERNDQIKLMRLIYSTANVVYASLIFDDASVDLALEWMANISMAHHAAQIQGLGYDAVYKKFPQLFVMPTTKGSDHGIWNALAMLLLHKHWQRLWIVQETVLAQRLMLIGDSRIIDLDSMEYFQEWLTLASEPAVSSSNVQLSPLGRSAMYLRWWAKFMYEKESRQPNTEILIKMIDGCLACNVTEPKDMIYGMVGIFDIEITVDYAKPIAVVYHDFAQCYFSKFAKLDFEQIGLAFNTEKPLELPSWLPNWNGPLYHEIIYQWAHADRNLFMHAGPAASTNICQHTLEIHGVECDTITEVHHMSGRGDFESWMLERVLASEDLTWSLSSGGKVDLLYVFLTVCYDEDNQLSDNGPLNEEIWLNFVLLVLRLTRGNDSAQAKFMRLIGRRTVLRMNSMSNEERSTAEMRAAKHVILMLRYPRTLFVTKHGRVGLGHAPTRPNDLVCVLQGFQLPMVLRKIDDHYVIVGRCFLLDLVSGEAAQLVADGKAKCEKLIIR